MSNTNTTEESSVTITAIEPGIGDHDIVLHNPEQLEIMQILTGLLLHTAEEIEATAEEATENESLAKMTVDWEAVKVDDARRWISAEGQLGWTVHLIGCADPRLLECLRGKLQNRGWDNVEVVAQK